MAGTSYDEGMQYNSHIESGQDIVTHATQMSHLYYPDIGSITTDPQHFKNK